MIKLLRHPSFRSDSFARETISKSHRIMLQDADQQLEDSLLALKFEKKKVFDETADGEASLWVRDPVQVIQRQIEQLTVDPKHNGVDQVEKLVLELL